MKPETEAKSSIKPHYKIRSRVIFYISTTLYLGLFLTGVLAIILGFPFDIFRRVQVFDTIVLAITVLAGLKLYERGAHKRGYYEGFIHATKIHSQKLETSNRDKIITSKSSSTLTVN